MRRPSTPPFPRGIPRPHGDEPHLLRWEHDRVPQGAITDLSRSELDVLEDAANGLTSRQSAIRRSRSAETVKSQRTSVLAKLGARNMVQAVALTISEREVTSEDARPIRFA